MHNVAWTLVIIIIMIMKCTYAATYKLWYERETSYKVSNIQNIQLIYTTIQQNLSENQKANSLHFSIVSTSLKEIIDRNQNVYNINRLA